MSFDNPVAQILNWELQAGFVLTNLYEDYWSDKKRAIDNHFPIFIATNSLFNREIDIPKSISRHFENGVGEFR